MYAKFIDNSKVKSKVQRIKNDEIIKRGDLVFPTMRESNDVVFGDRDMT